MMIKINKEQLSRRAYPVLVLQALEAGYRKYDDIRTYIKGRHDKIISTKTIYRHIRLIKFLGFVINDEPPYVTWPSDKKPIITDDRCSAKIGDSAYALMILVVLQTTRKTHNEIIEQIRAIFNTDIERKAVAKNLKTIEEIGYLIWDPVYFNYGLDDFD